MKNAEHGRNATTDSQSYLYENFSPVDKDTYLEENPGLLSLNVAELLTSSERKGAIDLLAEHKRQFYNPEQEASRVQSNSIYLELKRKELERRVAKDAERAKADLEKTTKDASDSPQKQVLTYYKHQDTSNQRPYIGFGCSYCFS